MRKLSVGEATGVGALIGCLWAGFVLIVAILLGHPPGSLEVFLSWGGAAILSGCWGYYNGSKRR